MSGMPKKGKLHNPHPSTFVHHFPLLETTYILTKQPCISPNENHRKVSVTMVLVTMVRNFTETHQGNGVWVQLQAPSEITISPVLLWLIVSVAALFFISGILHILLKYFNQKQLIPQSNRFNEHTRPQSLGRQLQQLFHLQDAGLDQSLIDSLPIFVFKHINGSKDPFDCAICLCEFSPYDKLKLIPICSHAFHTHCIDTWLISNSTCPLCRVNLSLENHHNGSAQNVMNGSTTSEIGSVSVRLGKFRSFNDGERLNRGEISRCNMDARRCFSMGSYQYVVNNMDLQVALGKDEDSLKCGKSEKMIKCESFSVSKIWLWSKKGSLENEAAGVSSSQNSMVTGL